MITVTIDETTPAGKRILDEIASNPYVGHVNEAGNDGVAGYVSVDEYFSRLRETVQSKHRNDRILIQDIRFQHRII